MQLSGRRATLANWRALAQKPCAPVAIYQPCEITLELSESEARLLNEWPAIQAALARPPGRAQSLLGLARASSAIGAQADAVKAATAFLAAWHLADRERPELQEMRALVR